MALSPARFVDPLTEGRQCWVQRDNGPAELHQVVNGTLMPVGDHTPTPKPRRWLDADAAPRPNYRPHRRQITRPVTPPVPKPAPQESKTMSTVNTAPANVNADTRMSGVVDWTKRAFAAGAFWATSTVLLTALFVMAIVAIVGNQRDQLAELRALRELLAACGADR